MSSVFYLKMILIIVFATSYNACSEKKNMNMVPKEQVNADKSTNYRYILREMIKRDKLRDEKKIKNKFKE
ncbi:MAG: hypothetical protein SVR08_14545 [Spirochaetota bacterium]|nr:hypothetical protein [Spirochaetota bacterium]